MGAKGLYKHTHFIFFYIASHFYFYLFFLQWTILFRNLNPCPTKRGLFMTPTPVVYHWGLFLTPIFFYVFSTEEKTAFYTAGVFFWPHDF